MYLNNHVAEGSEPELKKGYSYCEAKISPKCYEVVRDFFIEKYNGIYHCSKCLELAISDSLDSVMDKDNNNE